MIFSGTTWVYGESIPRLTLPAGCQLRFAPGARLAIGLDAGNWTGYRGQLTAVGTAAQPILFTADNGQNGGWAGLFFTNNADYGGATSQLEHAIVEKATTNLSLSSTTQPDTLRHLVLQGASVNGLLLSASPVRVANCQMLDNAIGVRVANVDSTWIGDDPALSNTFIGNGQWNLYNDGAGEAGALQWLVSGSWCDAGGQDL